MANTRSTTKAATTRQPATGAKATSATGTRKPNGTTRTNGRSNGATGFWPVTMALSTEVELAVEGKDGDAFGIAVCATCAAMLPGSEVSRALHHRWHEQVRGLEDSRAR